MTWQIATSVGKGGTNRGPDVQVVKSLINANLHLLTPLARLPEDGQATPNLVKAIEEFQRRIVNYSSPDGRVDPGGRTWVALTEQAAASGPGWADLESALADLKVQATNFANRFILDANVRQEYLRHTEFLAKNIREEVLLGNLTPKNAAATAHEARNAIMDAARIKTSDLGRAAAEAEKAVGKSLQELEEHYAKKLFQRKFSELSGPQKNRIWLEVVESSGRPSPKMTGTATRLGRLGKGLAFVSVAFAVYNVATADDPMMQAAKEGATTAAGILGGMGGGAVAGLACGPGAPVCVAVGVFVGGAAVALGVDLGFDWLTSK